MPNLKPASRVWLQLTQLFVSVPVHPDARPVRRLPLHGRVLAQRHPGPFHRSFVLAFSPSWGVSYVSSVFQLFDRIKLFGMPAKHQPDLIYLRYVPLWKVHVFTAVQLSCLIVLWAIKASAAAVVFPMMVRLTAGRPLWFCAPQNQSGHVFNPVASAGPGTGLHPEASGLLLHQERAELAGRPDTREQEEEGRRQEEEGEGGEGTQNWTDLDHQNWTELS